MKPDAFGKCIFNVSAYIPSFRMPSTNFCENDTNVFFYYSLRSKRSCSTEELRNDFLQTGRAKVEARD